MTPLRTEILLAQFSAWLKQSGDSASYSKHRIPSGNLLYEGVKQ